MVWLNSCVVAALVSDVGEEIIFWFVSYGPCIGMYSVPNSHDHRSLSYIIIASRCKWLLSDWVMVVCCHLGNHTFQSSDAHWYLSSSSMFLMTKTLACSGVPFSLMNILQFVVHVLWIFPCFFKYRAFRAMLAFRFVRYSFIKTFDPFSFLPCFNSAVLYFLLTNLMMMAGLSLSFLRVRGWQASMLLLTGGRQPLVAPRSWCLVQPPQPAVTARPYDRGLMRSPVTITSFTLVYCSNSNCGLSRYTRRRSFSAFWIRITSSNTSRTAFCCNLTAEIPSDKRNPTTS